MCFNNELYEIVPEDAVTTDFVLVFCSDTVVGAVTTSSMRLFRKALWQQTLYTYFVLIQCRCCNKELYEVVQGDAVTTDSVLVFCSDRCCNNELNKFVQEGTVK